MHFDVKLLYDRVHGLQKLLFHSVPGALVTFAKLALVDDMNQIHFVFLFQGQIPSQFQDLKTLRIRVHRAQKVVPFGYVLDPVVRLFDLRLTAIRLPSPPTVASSSALPSRPSPLGTGRFLLDLYLCPLRPKPPRNTRSQGTLRTKLVIWRSESSFLSRISILKRSKPIWC